MKTKINLLYTILFAVLLLALGMGAYFFFRSRPVNILNTTIVKASGPYAYKNTTNAFKTQFKANPTTLDGIVFENTIGKISFYTPVTQSFGTLASPGFPTTSGNTITYSNIFPQIDLSYTITSSRLLEEFIVKDAITAQFLSRIEQRATTSTTYIENEDGSISFFTPKKDKSTAFTLPHPVIYEVGNPNQKSTGIIYEITPYNDQLIITKVITEEGQKWLADKNRNYPIAIDLVIDNGDTSSDWTSSDATNTTVSLETTIKQEGSGSVKVQTTAGGGTNTGTGIDGACIVNNGTKYLDANAGSSVCNGSARSTAYAVNFSVTGNTAAGSTSVTVSTTPTGLVAGDEFLIINLKGTSGDNSNVGKYETHTVSSISTNTINFTDSPLANTYNGTTQKIMVQRVPNFSSVTVCGGNTGGGCTAAASLNTTAWNGAKNGVIFFRSTGAVIVNSGGTITTSQAGFRGGTSGSNGPETLSGNTSTGGGTGATGTASYGGNGGTQSQSGGNTGGNGATASVAGGTGIGGGGGGGQYTGYTYSGSGGGGSYVVSSPITNDDQRLILGNGSSQGAGGGGGVWSPSTGGAANGAGGSTNGSAGASGNPGGGIISIFSNSLTTNSANSLIANGGNGGIGGAGGYSGHPGAGGGGQGGQGGNGGTIALTSNSISLATESTKSIGGNGGTGGIGGNNGSGSGGAGGSGATYLTGNETGGNGTSGSFDGNGARGGGGRGGNAGYYGKININYSSSFSGTTSPTYNAYVVAGASLNDTVTYTTAATDLSTVANITYWVRSSVAGSYATFGFGESAATEQTNTITINQANTWEQKTWDISGITGTSRDAVTKYAFIFTGDTSGASFYFDDIQTNALFAPTLGTATSLSSTSVRWNFTDNSTEETGFKVYDSTGTSVLATCATTNLTYCDETGLTPNTQYTRKIGTYNASSTSITSGTVSGYTLAAVPGVPVVNTRTTTTVQVNPDPGTNSTATTMAIYKETGTTCDGSGGSYIAANGSDNGSTAVWQTDATWATVTVTGLTSETAYSFCVKAKNGAGTESAFGAVGQNNSGYVPLSGNFAITANTSILNKYVDGSDASRYVMGVDSGTGSSNTAVLELQSGVLTVNANETVVAGSFSLEGGSIAIANGGQLKPGSPLWAIDADADGYTSDTKLYYGSQPTNGRRKNLITTLGTVDCGDSSYSTANSCFMSGTGGTITTSGNYKIHKFTSSGTFVLTYAGNAEVLVVGGGGGAHGGYNGSAGGGGGGGYQYNASLALTGGSYPVTVGAGGSAEGGQGGSSIFSTITAIGGGSGGGNYQATGGGGGGGGASGGGGAPGQSNTVGGGSGSQGSSGGSGTTNGADGWSGGGGGGAQSAGGNASTYQAGAGGSGYASSISGVSVGYAGGGGGASTSSGGGGGAGGGGNGQSGCAGGSAGTPNTGGGAGGNCGTSFAGGSGIVIIKYQFQ